MKGCIKQISKNYNEIVNISESFISYSTFIQIGIKICTADIVSIVIQAEKYVQTNISVNAFS